jgi:hypothetical protein
VRVDWSVCEAQSCHPLSTWPPASQLEYSSVQASPFLDVQPRDCCKVLAQLRRDSIADGDERLSHRDEPRRELEVLRERLQTRRLADRWSLQAAVPHDEPLHHPQVVGEVGSSECPSWKVWSEHSRHRTSRHGVQPVRPEVLIRRQLERAVVRAEGSVLRALSDDVAHGDEGSARPRAVSGLRWIHQPQQGAHDERPTPMLRHPELGGIQEVQLEVVAHVR